MSSEEHNQFIAFLWNPNTIRSAVIGASRRTGAKALFDLSRVDPFSACAALLQADAGSDAAEIKVDPEFLLKPEMEELLDETELTRVWIELHPPLMERDPSDYHRRMEELSSRAVFIPVVGDVNIISLILDGFPSIRSIGLKGCESAGFVSSETAFTLFSTVRSMLSDRGDERDLIIWGGIAAPEAAAAFFVVGASGIVFESAHRLTDFSDASAEQREKIAKLRPDHTELTGLNLRTPCRLFNKGNSKAVKELTEFAGSLCGAEIRDEQRRFFAGKIAAESVPAHEAGFQRDELIPLGVEAAFADSFIRRFGSDFEHAVEGFISVINENLRTAERRARSFTDSPVAREMGTRYPFVQGAMSWITDVPEFAAEVAKAGALPTLALGMMDASTIEEKFGRLREILGALPYAVNVIALAENPHRDAQLRWIRENKPRFAVIAAGEPSHAEDLLAHGVEAIYIAPNEELLKMAFEVGVRYVICEGNEAGGHVGAHTTLTLAQTIIDLKDREPALFEGKRVIMAGGVYNRETALMAAMLGADAIQMGTVYLATEEIVETGALSELYRRMVLESRPEETVVTGEAVGLRVRSLRTPKTDAICTLERDFAAGSEDEGSFRHKIEGLAAGSLLTAARAVEFPGGPVLDERRCVDEGQYMSGASAGVINSVMRLEELHRELAEGTLSEGLPFLGPIGQSAARPAEAEARPIVGAPSVSTVRSRETRPIPDRERIAVTGMSLVNSLGKSPEEVWEASVAGKSGITYVPAEKWNHENFFSPRPRTPEKTYCRVGAFQHIDVTRKELGIPPQDFRTMTNSTRVTMWLAKNVVEQSGILDADIPGERVGVLISQNSGEAAATLQDVIIRGSAHDIVSSVKRVAGLSDDVIQAIEAEVKQGRIAIDDTTLLGRLNCSAGGFICNKYGFMGPSYSVSAACATALVALYSAYQMIRNGIIDAALVGGAEELLTPMHFLEFSALGALAGLSGVDRPPAAASRPFDRDRDGMVLGEGGGMILIERESIAKKRGAPILAYISAMGASNNNLGMVESSAVTQELAIGASFNDAPYEPDEVDLVECHATGTMQGDVEEVHALARFFATNGRTALTSFKSQIGHTLGASGVNSLIRGIMAMRNTTLPPTLNYEQPDPDIDMDKGGFYVPTEPMDWPDPKGRPRRLQVNAFGFGGSNYVVHLEEATDDEAIALVSPKPHRSVERESRRADLPDGLFFFRTEIAGRSYRVAVTAESEREAVNVIEQAEPLQNGNRIPPKRLRSLARQGAHLAPADEPPSPLAFVFPGQGSHYAGMAHELYETFPVIRKWMDKAAEIAEFDLLRMLFYDKEEDLQKTRWQQPALFTMEYAMVRYLTELGVRPTALAGHSLGELTALCLSGVYSFEDGFRIVNKRAQCMDKACALNVDPGVMMAADAPLDLIEKEVAEREKVYITNINSPHQIVIGGDTERVQAFGAELKEQGYRSTLLRVSMAFHSPIMECIHDELEEFIATVPFNPPNIPVISNTTMRCFPDDEAEIKRIVMAHLESPVHWMQNVRTLYDDYGVRTFVEVGPRDILSNLISDAIEGSDCIQTCLPSAESLMYRTALAQIYARGGLEAPDTPKFVAFPGQPAPEPARPALKQPVPAPAQTRAPRAPQGLDRIIQREINAFIIESFGRFLKPVLLEAIRREHDPNFTENDLDRVLSESFPAVETPPMRPAPAIPPQAAPAPPIPSAQPVTAPESEPAAQPSSPPPAESADTEDVTEAVIGIIMDATGYERDEIEPEMDLREDLSIRSSRLPVIMDSVESHFGIKIELEDFMDVRTIKDIAERISQLIAKNGGEGTSRAAEPARVPSAEPAAAPEAGEIPEETRQDPRRAAFREVRLEQSEFRPLELDGMEAVVVLGAGVDVGLRTSVGDVFRRDYGVSPISMSFLSRSNDESRHEYDVMSEEGALKASEVLSRTESLAGVVFVLDDPLDEALASAEDASRLLTGLFRLTRALLDSTSKRFALAVYRCDDAKAPTAALVEGVLGMFLSLAQEFSSVQFRVVRLDGSTDLGTAIRGAMDRSRTVIEQIYRAGEAFTQEARISPVPFREEKTLDFGPDDVIVFSGGAQGVTTSIAEIFVPFGCRLVFLGRTMLDAAVDFRSLLEFPGDPKEEIASRIRAARPDLSEEELVHETERAGRGFETIRTVERFRSMGVEASYYSCDVTDAKRTRSVMEGIIRRYGRIDGVVHGAGILKDNFAKQMPPEDFSAVTRVKLDGAWNLYKAASRAGLRFFVCLSSGAAVQGNPGQSNYAAGNRMMSGLMRRLAAGNPSVVFKALMLPPIEGTGMAEDPEIRALMKRMNADYVHVNELTALTAAELAFGPPEDIWVMFLRSLPDLDTVRLDQSGPFPDADRLYAGAVEFRTNAFPMIDAVVRADLEKGELLARRGFSPERDLWLPDHKPFKFMRHPLVSAIMAVETFMEAARILYPSLRPVGIRDAEFIDIIEAPAGQEREAIAECRRIESKGPMIAYEVSLSTYGVSRAGRPTERLYTNYTGVVVTGAPPELSAQDLTGFPVTVEELDTRPMDHKEVLRWYEDRSHMQGRYRVLDELDGTADGAVRGRFVYRFTDDFAPPLKTVYQYSPYLLEALMQLVNFYVVMRDESEERAMIPVRIGRMLFYRTCRDGEPLTLEARISSSDQEGITWNARAVDADGETVMFVRDVRMKWFTA